MKIAFKDVDPKLPKSRAEEWLEGGISGALKSTIDSITKFLVNYTKEFYKEFFKPLNVIVEALTTFAKGYWDIILKIREAIYKFFSEKITEIFNSFIDKIKEKIDKVKKPVSKIGEFGREGFNVLVNKGKEGFTKVKDKGKEIFGFGGDKEKTLTGTPTEEQSVITKLDDISAKVDTLTTNLEIKGEDTTLTDSINKMDETLLRIESTLGLNDIALALEEIRLGLQSVFQTGGEENAGVTPGEKFDIIEAKLTDNEIKLAEKTNDLGVEVRDSKRSVQSDIADVKAKLDVLIKVIEEKAMTFDEIYKKFGYRLARDHRNKTGRIVG